MSTFTTFLGLSLGVPNGVAGLVEKTLGTWRIIANAKNFGSNAGQAVMMLQFEAFRYLAWTQESGALMKSTAADQLSFKYNPNPVVTNAVRATPSMSIHEALYKAIVEIHVVLQEVDELLNKYDRAFESASQMDSEMLGKLSSSLATLGNEGPVAAQAVVDSHALQSNLQKEVSIGSRVNYGIQTWNEPDKVVLKELVDRFKYWNNGLYELIPPPRKNLLESKLSANIVGPTNSAGGLKRIQSAANESSYSSIEQSAKLKEAISDPNRQDAGLKKCYKKIGINQQIEIGRRTMTWYSESGELTSAKPQRVIVEWYYYNTKWIEDQINLANERVEQLAYNFSIKDKPRFLRVLDCIGYVCHPEKADRALLYAVPLKSPVIGPIAQSVSLYQILSPNPLPGVPTARPSLSERFRLASLLAISFFELQNVSWLHKSFHSDNVLFFATKSSRVSFAEPYISGFDFSRPDKAGQISLETDRSPLGLYRHPDLRKARPLSAEQPCYTRAYDVYSLGMVLFEIGMWRRLDEFLKPKTITPSDFRKRVETYLQRDMALLMGDVYRDVVAKCISGECLTGALPESEAQDWDGSPDGAAPQGHDIRSEDDIPEQQNAPLENARLQTESFAEQAMSESNNFYISVVSELQRCHCGVGVE